MKTIINNAMINGVTADYLNINDRAIHYGDGLFETVLCCNNMLWYWSRHYARLQQSCPAARERRRRGGRAAAGASDSKALLPARRDPGDRAPGRLRKACHACVVVFYRESIQDHGRFTDPHQYGAGMVHVSVNGVQVLADSEHTGALPGRVVRGAEWTGWNE